MSKTIDQKVVEMRFDNGQFEKGVSETINSVSNLKKSLDFGGFASSMTSAANGIGRNLETISGRFTTLGVVATTALVDISRQAINTGIDLINSLTVDQIAAGFEKYSQMAISTQTIMSATRKEWANEVDQMDYVSDQLERLLWFTDETSYNFVDMVDSIGKFTSAGIDLDTAVTNIMGIATWAGLSGQNALTASRAMYQLAQAAGKGYVQAIDWASIETVNMATTEFKNILIDTAVEMGTLNQVFDDDYGWITFFGDADEYLDTLDLIENGTVVTAENIRTTLAKKWLTTDVLSAALDEFGKFPDALSREIDKFNEDIQDVEDQIYTTEYLEYLKLYKADLEQLTETSEKLGIPVSALWDYVEHFNDGTLDLEYLAQRYDLTVDELTGELSKYKDGLFDLNEVIEEYPGNVYKLQEGFDKLASSEYDIGLAAFLASQESRTLSDAINYARDAVSSGWMTTFNLVIGELLDAKKVFATVSNELYEVFVADGEARNRVLKEWAELGGRDVLMEAVYSAWLNMKDILFAIKDGFHDIFPRATADQLLDITNKLKDFIDGLGLSDVELYKIRKTVSDVLGTLKTVGSNVLRAFQTIGTNIKRIAAAFSSAWSKIFPSSMSNGYDLLVRISEKFADFVDKTLIGGERFARLERTFQGFFAVLDIVAQLITSILKPITGFDANIGGLGDTILETTAKIGDWLVELDKAVKEGDVFDTIIGKITGFFEKIKQGFIDFKNGITGFIEEITGKSLSDIWSDITTFVTQAKDNITQFFSQFNKSDTEEGEEKLSLIARIFETLTGWVKDLKDSFNEAKPYIDDFVKSFSDTIDLESFLNVKDADELMRKVGGWGIILLGFVSVIKGIEEFDYLFRDWVTLLRDGLSSLDWVVEGLGESFWNLQKTIKANVILKIASALLIIAIAILMLASIKDEALENAIGAFAIIGAIVVGIFETLMKLNNVMDVGLMLGIGKALQKVCFAILEIAVALAIVATAAEDVQAMKLAANVLTGVIGVILLFFIVVEKARIDPKRVSAISAAVAILGFAMIEIAAALAIVAMAAKNPDALEAGTIALAAMLGAIAIFCIAMQSFNVKAGRIVSISAAVILISVAMVLIAGAIGILASLPATPDDVKAAANILFEMLAAIGVFYVAMSNLNINAGKMTGISASIILLSISLMLVAGAVAIIANVAANGGDIVRAGAILGAFMMVVGLFYAAMDKLQVSAGKILVISMSLILVGTALLIMANAIALVASYDPENLAGAFITLVLLLAVVGIALAALSEQQGNILGAAFAITLAAAGIILLAYALKILAEAGADIGTVVTLGFALLVVVGAAFLAEKVAPGMYALAIACAAIGAGALMAGIGMLKFAEGLTMIFALGTDGIDLWNYAIEHLGELIPGLVAAFIAGLGLIGEAFMNNGNNLIAALTLFFEIIIQAALNILPMLLELFKQTFLGLVDLVYDLTPVIFSLIAYLTEQLLNSMMLLTPQITAAALFILTDTLEQLAANIGEIVYLLTDIAIKVTTATIEAFIDHIPDFIDLGWKFIIALIEGMADGLDNNAEDLMNAITHLAQSVIDTVCKFLGIESPSTKFLEIGKNIVLGWINGMSQMLHDLKAKVEEIAKGVMDKVNEFFSGAVQVGKDLINGLIEGIGAKAKELWDKVSSVCSSAIAAAKEAFDEHSPSKVFYDIGENVDKGLINGVDDYSNDVDKSISTMANSAINNVKTLFEDINTELEDGMDSMPTIRPVLDLTDITSGVQTMNDMFNNDYALGLSNNADNYIASQIAKKEAMLNMVAEMKNRSDNALINPAMNQQNTFNITGDDPKAIANEVSTILQNQVDRRNAVWA